MDHSVAIATFQTDCKLNATAARAEGLRRAIDDTLRRLLPVALQDALGPALDGHDGVVRIRQIDLSLTHMNPLQGRDLAAQIAQRIAQIVRQTLRGGTDGVQIWPTQDAYLADYILWRLGRRAGAAWAFAQFASLDQLSPQQAAIEVIAARPSVLFSLTNTEHAPTRLHPLAHAFDPEMAVVLIQRLTGDDSAPDIPRLLAIWQQVQSVFAHGTPSGSIATMGQIALSTLLSCLTHTPRLTAPRNIADLTHLTILHAALRLLPPDVLAAFSTSPASPSQAVAQIAALKHTVHDLSLPAAIAKRITPLLANNDILPLVAAMTATMTDDAQPPNMTTAASVASDRISPVAGLCLLMKPLMQRDPDAMLTAKQRNAVLIACLPPDLQDAATGDAGFAMLFPADPMAAMTEWPTPDARDLRDGPSAAILTATDGPALWAQCLIAQFALNLPGLAQSSLPYLQSQFLTRSGLITTAKETTDVILDPVPLGIVLSMAGLLGNQGRVPWLDNQNVTITINGGT